jgi:hypothetical protein
VLDELSAIDFHELDRATCLWLLATEHLGRLQVLEPDRTSVPVSYVVAGETLEVRVETGPAAVGCTTGTPVAFDVDVFDVFSQVGWNVHVRGAVVDLADGVLSNRERPECRRPEMRHPDGRWMHVIVTAVTGRWFRAPECLPVFVSARGA